MAKTKPGVERITKQTMTAQLAHIRHAVNQHLDNCARCKVAKGNPDFMCGAWWNLSVLLYQVRSSLRIYEQPDSANMDMLPGMEDI